MYVQTNIGHSVIFEIGIDKDFNAWKDQLLATILQSESREACNDTVPVQCGDKKQNKVSMNNMVLMHVIHITGWVSCMSQSLISELSVTRRCGQFGQPPIKQHL